MSNHSIILDYLKDIMQELTDGAVTFNFSQSEPDTYSIVTRYADKTIRSYINGDEEKEYGFEIVMIRQYSSDEDDLNLEAMEFGQGLIELLDEKNRDKDFPDLGTDTEVESVEVLQNMPNLAGINADEALAQYRVQGRIVYKVKNLKGWD